MNDAQFRNRATLILHNMAVERTGWRALFARWCIHHEPLRNDAANLLREAGFAAILEKNTRYVGGPSHD